MLFLYLPVLILWLERHQKAIFASRQDMLWGRTVDLLKLVASFLTPPGICSYTHKVSAFLCRGFKEISGVAPYRRGLHR